MTTKRFLIMLAAIVGTAGAWAQSTDDEVTVTPTGNVNEWTLTMPAGNMELEVTYATELQAEWIQAIAEQTYTGSAIEPTVTVKNGETTLTLGTDYTVAYTDNTNAGTATVTVTGAGSDYNGTVTATFTIAKATPTVTAPTAKTDLVYTGKAQELVTAGSTTGGTLQYSTDGENYATDLPTGTDTGEYTVYYKVVGDDNNNDVAAAGPITVTISKATPEVTAPTAVENLVYSGEAQTLIAAGTTTGGTLQYSTDGETYAEALPTGTDAKEYTVYYKVVGDDNYNDVAAASITVTIGKATPEVTAPTAVADLVYNGEAQTLIAAGKTTSGTLQYSTDGETYATDLPTGTDAKEYTVYYKVVGDDNNNGAEAKTITVTIAKATPTVTAPTANTLTYTGAAQTLITAGSTSGGTLQYSLDGETYAEALPTGTEAKDYTVYYKVVGDDNYNDVAAKSITVTIATDQAVADVIAKINAIGTVAYTDESKALIDAAREAYAALTEAQQALVTNYETLTTAETTYSEQKAAADAAAKADKDAADAVIAKIEAIGTVAYTDESKALIDEARKAYDALTEAQQALVTNYETLTTAETTYSEQKAAAEEASKTQTVEVETPDGETVKTEVTVEVTSEDKQEVTITAADAASTGGKVAVPAAVTIKGEKYNVTAIAADAFKGKTEVTDIYLPETTGPLTLGENALKIDEENVATVHTPLALLDDYAVMAQLKQNVKAGQVQATVTAPNRYWTFSCGVDVMVPEGVSVYTCKLSDAGKEAVITEIDADVIKATNGVLVVGTAGNTYEIVVSKSDSHTSVATTDAGDYDGNLLVPVIESAHYDNDSYYVLKGNEFHAITNGDASSVPACKAVLRKPAGVSAARRLVISNGSSDGTTGIFVPTPDPSPTGAGSSEWYNLNGQRIDRPTTKGLYIKDGKKVIIK